MAFKPLSEEEIKLRESKAGSEPIDGQKDRSFAQTVGRELALIGRAAATPETVGMAAGALAGLPMRAPGAGAQAGGVAGLITNIGSEIYKALSGDPNARSVNDILEEAKNAIGLPKPETGAERLQERVIQGATAAIPGVQALDACLQQQLKAPLFVQLVRSLPVLR